MKKNRCVKKKYLKGVKVMGGWGELGIENLKNVIFDTNNLLTEN